MFILRFYNFISKTISFIILINGFLLKPASCQEVFIEWNNKFEGSNLGSGGVVKPLSVGGYIIYGIIIYYYDGSCDIGQIKSGQNCNRVRDRLLIGNVSESSFCIALLNSTSFLGTIGQETIFNFSYYLTPTLRLFSANIYRISNDGNQNIHVQGNTNLDLFNLRNSSLGFFSYNIHQECLFFELNNNLLNLNFITFLNEIGEG